MLIIFLLLIQFSQLLIDRESVFSLLEEKVGITKLAYTCDSSWKSQNLFMVP